MRKQWKNWNCSFLSFHECLKPKYSGNHKHKNKCTHLDVMATFHKLNEIHDGLLLESDPFIVRNINSVYLSGKFTSVKRKRNIKIPSCLHVAVENQTLYEVKSLEIWFLCIQLLSLLKTTHIFHWLVTHRWVRHWKTTGPFPI